MDEELKKFREVDKEKRDLSPAIALLREGEYIKDVKLEVAAVTALYLGEVLEEFKKSLSEIAENGGIKRAFESENPENPNLEKLLTNLHLYLFNLWKKSAAAWKARKDENESDEVYDYSKNIIMSIRYDEIDVHFSQGFNTSLDVMLGLIELFIKKYTEDFAKNPEPEDIEKYINNPSTLRIILVLANSSLDNFSFFGQKTLPHLEKRRSSFKPELFYLEETEKGLVLKLAKGAMDYKPEDLKRITRDEIRTGCPALIAKDGDKNVIVSTWEIIKQIFREVYYPSLEEHRK